MKTIRACAIAQALVMYNDCENEINNQYSPMIVKMKSTINILRLLIAVMMVLQPTSIRTQSLSYTNSMMPESCLRPIF